MKRKLSLLLTVLMTATVLASSGCAPKQNVDMAASDVETAAEATQAMLLRDDSIYYINLDDNGRLYRINKDGSGDTAITQEANIGQIQFLSDVLKYTVFTSDYSDIVGNFFCTLDGKNPVELK